ncbi:hypothetical protein C0R09_07850 [Brevibacillus laterosporus]|uniref:hypothetical protein n=1 Tax=Brevibacillus laterosporus TaxID=1465 RepID=UPI000C78A256|nr:hypothetical protein [Brevibacillus laterosporus]AUM64452.1 hypothetical protein C0R09_07850 [Brevibacillus laterosporus]
MKEDLVLNEITVKPEFINEITEKDQKLAVGSLPPKAISYKAISNHAEIYLAAEIKNGEMITGLSGWMPIQRYVVAGSLEIAQAKDSHNSEMNWTIIMAPILAIFFIGYIIIRYSKCRANK